MDHEGYFKERLGALHALDADVAHDERLDGEGRGRGGEKEEDARRGERDGVEKARTAESRTLQNADQPVKRRLMSL